MKRTTKKLPSLSIFFPAFNEEKNIARALSDALKVAPTISEKFEIIVINDGSKDKTAAVAASIAQLHPQVRVVSQRNRGYGGALKRGFKEARYEWIFFTDSDLQFNIAELKKFVAHTRNYQVVLGYRGNRAEGWKRQLIANALKIWNRILLGFPRRIKDIDCAFKLIHRSVVRSIEPLFSDGAMVSTELLLKIHKAKYPYQQVSVTHYNRRHGTPTGNKLNVITKAVQDTFYLQRKLAYFTINSSYQKSLFRVPTM